MFNDIVKDVTRTEEGKITTPSYTSPNGFGEIISGVAQGFGTLIDYAQKGAARDAKAATEDIDWMPGLLRVQEYQNMSMSGNASPEKMAIEYNRLTRDLIGMNYNPTNIKQLYEVARISPQTELIDTLQKQEMAKTTSEALLKDKVAREYGIQGSFTERQAGASELLNLKAGKALLANIVGPMTSDQQDKFLRQPGNLSTLYASITTDMDKAIIDNNGTFDSEMLMRFKEIQKNELYKAGIDPRTADAIVDEALTDYEGIAKRQREGQKNTAEEIKTMSDIQFQKTQANFNATPFSFVDKNSGETIILTGAQLQLAEKYFPEDWKILLTLNPTQNAIAVMSGKGSISNLNEHDYKFFLKDSVQQAMANTDDPDVMGNAQEAGKRNISTANAEYDNLPESLKKVDQYAYGPAIVFNRQAQYYTADKIERAYKGDKLKMREKAQQGAEAIAKGFNGKYNDTLIQVDDNFKVRVYANIPDVVLTGAKISGSLEGEVTSKVNPGFKEVTGEGFWMPLGSYDAVEAGTISDMALTTIENMSKYGLTIKEARDMFNRTQIVNSNAAMKYLNQYDDYSKGLDITQSLNTRKMTDKDIQDVIDALKGSRKTTSAKLAENPWAQGVAEALGSPQSILGNVTPTGIAAQGVVEMIAQAGESPQEKAIRRLSAAAHNSNWDNETRRKAEKTAGIPEGSLGNQEDIPERFNIPEEMMLQDLPVNSTEQALK